MISSPCAMMTLHVEEKGDFEPKPNRLPRFLRRGTTQSLCYVHPDFFKDLKIFKIIQDVWSNPIRHLLYGC